MDMIANLRRQFNEGWQPPVAEQSPKKEQPVDSLNLENEEPEIEYNDDGGLASQLSAQVQYNSELLSQISELEGKQLSAQRDAQEKQISLKNALAVCDGVRNDALELKERLDETQQRTTQLHQQLKDANATIANQARDLSLLSEKLDELSEVNENLRNDKEALQGRADGLAREKSNLQNRLNSIVCDHSTSASKLQAQVDSLTTENQELLTKYEPLEDELEQSRQALREIQMVFEKEKRRMTDTLTRAEMAEDKARQMERSKREAESVATQLRKQLQETKHRTGMFEQQASSAKEHAGAKEKELADMRQRLQEMAKEAREKRTENDQLTSELEALGNELITRAQNHMEEVRGWERKLMNAQQDAVNTFEEAQAREQDLSKAMENKTQEFAQKLKESETRFHKLQKDHSDLHDLLKSVQDDGNEQLQKFDKERMDYETKLVQTEKKLASTQKSGSQANAKANDTERKLKKEIQNLHTQTVERSERHVSMLNALQDTLMQLALDAKRTNEDVSVLAADFSALQTALPLISQKQATPVQQWADEARHAFAFLTEEITCSKRDCEVLRDNLRESEVQREEERGHSIMVQDEKQALSHELQQTQSRAETFEKKMTERLNTSQQELKNSELVQADLNAELERLRQQLQQANDQSHRLQEDNQRVTRSMTQNQSRQNSQIQRLEQEAGRLKEQNDDLEGERDSLQTKKKILEEKLKTVSDQLRETNETRELEKQQSEIDQKQTNQQKRTTESHNRQLLEAMKAMELQLKQNKQLLQVVQQQRSQLQTENSSLRSQLDDVFQQTLRSGSGHRPQSIIGNRMAASKATVAAALQRTSRTAPSAGIGTESEQTKTPGSAIDALRASIGGLSVQPRQ